ncbi:MAG: hypothetical protein JSS79_07815 [Bacteroidetes bacterium]|nr:hypothetical protein [Bacteroidota bacterium]
MNMDIAQLYKSIVDLDTSPNIDLVSAEGIWSKILTDQMNERNNAEKVRWIKFLIGKYQNIVAEARKGRIHLAWQLATEADRMVSGLNDEEGLLVIAFALPAKAYLYYKELLYEKALLTTREALTVGEKLEGYGYSIFHYHRIQQMHNVCRVLFRRNELAEAMTASNETLRYIMIKDQPNSFPGRWNDELLDIVPRELKSAMIMQVIHEVHLIWDRLSNTEPDRKNNFEAIFGGLIDNFTPYTRDEHSIHRWLLIKRFYYKNNYNSFCDEALLFLKQEPKYFDFFKQSLVNDIVNAIKDHQIEEALNVYSSTKLTRISNPIPTITA